MIGGIYRKIPYNRFLYTMLSILIPTYNYDCTLLVERLVKEADDMKIDVEILVADDASTDNNVRTAISALSGMKYCRIFMQDKNGGRAYTRNFLAQHARYNHFLFLDADGMPVNEHFLSLYINEIGQSDVICGSILHPEQCPSPFKTLRHRYEKEAEKRFTAVRRNKKAYASFRSFNFMITREAFRATRFDEDFKDYGYEDLLFGRQLKEHGFAVKHIENPMLNMDIEDNDVFLSKVRESNFTLKKFYVKLREDSSLIHAYELLGRFGLQRMAAWVFKFTEKGLTSQLIGVNPSLSFLKIYKLLHFASLMAE